MDIVCENNRNGNPVPIPRVDVIQAVMGVRFQIEEAGWGGGSLMEINVSATLLLYDLCQALGLSHREQEVALGDSLAEIEEYIGRGR